MNALTIFFGSMVLAVGFALLLSLPVWLLWNWLVPGIFGLPEIGLFQAFGLMVLCSFLFKSSASSK